MPNNTTDNLDEDQLRTLVASWTYPGYRFNINKSGRLRRNKGRQVLEVVANARNLLNADPRFPGQLTTMQMEIDFKPPMNAITARRRGLDLLRWMVIHEVGEFFQEQGHAIFDPHKSDSESQLYNEISLLPWNAGVD